MNRVLAFIRKHKKGEERVAIAISIEVVYRLLAGVLGASVASAAIIATGMIDLSNNNGARAAAAIATPGVQAVEAKATEGLGFRDSVYPTFRAAAAKYHRAFGGYLFLHYNESGKAQADYFLAYAKPKPGDLQPVVDTETGSPCSAAPATYAALHELELKGFHPIMYTSAYWLSQLAHCAPELERFRVWEAEYGPVLNQVAGFHDIAWQFTDRASESGFSVDGSHLMVRSVAQLEYKPASPLTPAQKAAKALAARKAHLRTLTGYFAWYEWRHAVARWKGLEAGEKDARPDVQHKISERWWIRGYDQWAASHP